jgi:predicted transposase YbfD/YdcC
MWPVKDNQPELLAALADAFDDEGVSPRERKLAEAERQKASSYDKKHGRRERRTLISTTALNDYLDWPGVAQCCKLVRQRTIHGQTSTETVFGITSLPREKADAQRLLKLVRQHWVIENGVFYVRDVTMGEDGCRVRTGDAASILSVMRNVVLNLLNRLGVANKAAALRRHAAHPQEALRLVRPSG